jgi:hypothetical protein
MKNKHVKSFNEAIVNLNESNMDNKYYDEITPLTIEEYSMIRESLWAVKTSTSVSAYQAKEFFKDKENLDTVIDKLELLLLFGSEKKF